MAANSHLLFPLLHRPVGPVVERKKAHPQALQPCSSLYDRGQRSAELGGSGGRCGAGTLEHVRAAMTAEAGLLIVNGIGLAVPQPHHQVGDAGVMERAPRAAGLAYGLLRRCMEVLPRGTSRLKEHAGRDLPGTWAGGGEERHTCN